MISSAGLISGKDDGTAAERTVVARVLRVVDGDTFVARLACWPGMWTEARVRLRGVGAPGVDTANGQACGEVLSALIDGTFVTLARLAPGGSGDMVLAQARLADGRDLGGVLGRQSVYRGKRARTASSRP